jgi:RimJ/RimL family protein N-acetyltransferase
MTSLIQLQDTDFDWFLDGSAPSRAGLMRPPGGIDEPFVLNLLRRMTRRLTESECRGAWMVVAANEVVGLCSYKAPPSNGRTEIGYGIAASRRNLGHATRAVKSIIEVARRDPALDVLVAETATANPSSERVLEKNGFAKVGWRHDPGEGPMNGWEFVLRSSPRPVRGS